MNRNIVVVSDNHGDDEVLKKIRRQNKDAYAFIHCGDSSLPDSLNEGFAIVSGNNDFFNNYPKKLIIDVNEYKIYVTHSENVGSTNRKRDLSILAKNNGCQICCYGHTHVFDVDEVNGVLLVNPGALRFPRDGYRIGYAVIHITSDGINVERKYLG